ncbi:MAG: Polyprenyl synthetase [Ignavibacteria bacterium]|nr:Polyprenyl synthetase [Ignavibacteria bacterium]
MNLKDIEAPVAHHLEEFNHFFKSQMLSEVALLNLIIKYLTKKKGKQVRPLLVFLSAQLCGKVSNRTHIGAAMVELLHTATLIHDDVVDLSTERRGMRSINAEWNNKIAVLIGDYLLARGLLSALDTKEFEILQCTSKSVRRMSEGELLQIEKSKRTNTDEKIYYKIISFKTASLLSTCCEVGAISATSDTSMHEALSNFGENLGMAFQIRDDIFDYQDNGKIIGKPVGNDLKEKKITLPLIYALATAPKHLSKEIHKKVKEKKINQKEIKTIIEFVNHYGGIAYSEQKAKEFSEKAVDYIIPLKDSPAKTSLIKFAEFVIERDS